MTTTTAMIEFDRVSIVFGGAPESALPLMDRGQTRAEVQKATGQVLGVHDCSLTVERGEISVLMGLSGSGKSTLLRAVNGLNPVVRGRVMVRGTDGQAVDVVTCGPESLRALRRGAVSMVFQQFALLPWRSVVENVALGLCFHRRAKEDPRALAREALERVGLGERLHHRPTQLSVGQQQRVAIARALAGRPSLVLADEPTANLDAPRAARCLDLLVEFAREREAALLVVTHDPAVLERFPTRMTLRPPPGGREEDR